VISAEMGESLVKETDIAIMVSQQFSEHPYEDDLALKKALEESGYGAEIVAWDNRDFDFSYCHLAIIRSCWDYDQRIDEFLEKMQTIAQNTILVNDIKVVIHNYRKEYLLEMNKMGIETVPTRFVRKMGEIESALQFIKSDDIIIKPAISASGKNTFRVHKKDIKRCYRIVKTILNKTTAMIQEYIRSIEICGEKSVVVINGEITYAMLKKPHRNGFLVHIHHGGTYFPDRVEEDELEFIQKIIKTFDQQPAYMRIDLLRDEDTRKIFLPELELIEPNLYLSKNKRGLELLSKYLISRLP